MPTTQNIVIDLNTRGANPVAFTHQGDTARSFVFEVYNNGETFSLTGYTAKIAAMLPADKGYHVIAGENMATGTISDNTITATLPAEFSAKPGNGVLTIILTGSGASIRPINVDFRIQKSADAPETIAGASDFVPILEQYIAEDMATYINAWLDEHPDAAAYYITGSKLVVDSNGILSLETDTDEIVEALDLGTLRSDVDDLKSDLLELQNGGYVADAQRIGEVIDNWLDAHPEATTTVQDGAITEVKFADSLKLKAIKDYVTPEMFGAKGDGVTDDSEAINKMITDSEVKNFRFTAKTYYCENDVTVSVSDCHFEGSGMYTSIVKLAENVSFTVNKERNTFQNIRFQGGDGVICNKYHVTFNMCWFQNAAVGITVNNGYIVQFTNCYITHNNLGVILNNQSYETVFVGCVIDNNYTVGVLIVGDTSGPVFDSCTLEGNYNRTTTNGCGIYIASSNTRVEINNCHFEANGTSQYSADVYVKSWTNSNPETTDLSAITTEVRSIYDGSLYQVCGIVNISQCRFFSTKYGAVIGGNSSTYNIHDCYFSGIINKNNKPILINGSNLVSCDIHINNNRVYNTDNSNITTEMLNGIKSSYIYTDIVPLESQFNKLIDGVIMLDNTPLFLYKGRVSDLDGTAEYAHLTCADGTSTNGGIINGTVTNYYPDATKTIYVSTESATYNIFQQSGYNEFIAITNNKSSRVNTSNGWKTFSRNKYNVFPINRYTLNSQEMYSQNDAIVYMVIFLSANDVKKMQGCIAFEPTDLSMYEFRS